MQEVKFRTLKADEIECRPAMVKDGKATILLYISSRAVVRILNETVGPMNWTMDFKEVNGQVVGRLGIWDEEKGMFIYKEDTGSESNIEAQKGLISDCYKRCLSRWGVDELYSAPKIVIPDDGYGYSGYKVSHIEYNDKREISHIRIVNRFGKEVFSFREDPVETDEQRRLNQLHKWFTEKKKDPSYPKDKLIAFKDKYKAEAANFRYPNYNCDILWKNFLQSA